ncbi:MAG: hypothetical protein A2057_03580 [Ignavibacteria bacterium GWA2_35_9]|nr:MAG: hypothetical protein A2057_03580 [Ignavibacteria bacterium GWA2_35_9]OGU43130.1 MAG: hypothetical protein A2000_16815 [Ignavibacteria bacterium GWB2_36_8]OGU51078.1 MAG: hypothetical protein A2080_06500 [Ignavibacteria bacterium GWC2_36_12]
MKKIRIINAKYSEDFKIIIKFNNKQIKIVDLKKDFKDKLDTLNDEQYIKNFVINSEKTSLSWRPFLIGVKELYEKGIVADVDLIKKYFVEKSNVEKTVQANSKSGLVGIIIGIIGIIVSIIVVLYSTKEKELYYSISKTKTQIVKAGQSSNLQVRYDTLIVHSDITAVHLMLWNNGKQSIFPTDVLERIIITTSKDARILEAKITKTTRDVSDISLKKINENEIEINWRVLEKNDGAMVQIIYTGNSETNITIKGLLLEQGKIKYIEYSSKTGMPWWLVLISVAIAILYVKFIFFDRILDPLQKIWIENIRLIIGVALLIGPPVLIFYVTNVIYDFVANSPINPFL